MNKYQKQGLWIVIGIMASAFFALIAYGTWVDASQRREAAALHEKLRQENAEKRAKAEAEMKAKPPAEHLAAMQAIYAGEKKTGFNQGEQNRLKGLLAYIPASAKEYAPAKAILDDGNKQLDIAVKKEIAQGVQALKDAQKRELAENRKHGVNIGMTAERVLQSSWGRPEHVNRTTFADNSVHEQWCYSSGNYLYFEDGILVTIQN